MDRRVSVTIGAKYQVTTEGVAEAKRAAEALHERHEEVRSSAVAAGEAMVTAMERSGRAVEEAARRMRELADHPRTLLQQAMRAVGAGDYEQAGRLNVQAARQALRQEDSEAFAYAQRLTAVLRLARDQDAGEASRRRFETAYRDLATQLEPQALSTNRVSDHAILRPEVAMNRAAGILGRAEADLAGGLRTQGEVQRMERDLYKVAHYIGQAREGGADPQKLERLNEHLRNLTEALEENREALEKATAHTAPGAPGAPGARQPDGGLQQSLLDELRRLASQGLSSIPGGHLLGRLGMAGLAVGAPVAAFHLARATLGRLNAPGREEVAGLADLARQYDLDVNPLTLFRNDAGFTAEEIARYNFTATQAGALAGRYNLPGGMTGDIASILAFSRTTGLDEQHISDLVRRLGVGGAFARGEAQDALEVLKAAVIDGIKQGVAGSDTLRNLVNIVEEGYRQNQQLSGPALAFNASLQRVLAETGNRALQGDAGAAAQRGLYGALAGGGDFAMQLALINAVGPGNFSAHLLGMTDDSGALTAAGQQYEALRAHSPIEAILHYAMPRIAAGNVSGNLMAMLGSALEELTGSDPMLMSWYLQSVGVQGDAALHLVGNTRSTLVEAVLGAGRREALASDIQGGNRLDFETRALEAIEADERVMRGLVDLMNTGGAEAWLRRTWEGIQTAPRRLFNPGMAGNMNFGAGRQDYGSASPIRMGGVRMGGFADAEASARALVRAMASGVEANAADDVNGRTGAFGWTQILPANLIGSAGWDRAFLDSDGAQYAAAFAASGLWHPGQGPLDPIPDAVARQGGEALREWLQGLEVAQQELVAQFLQDVSVWKLTRYQAMAAQYGVTDPEEQAKRAAAAWYTGPGERPGQHPSVLSPEYALDDSNPWYTARWWNPNEPSVQEYLERLWRKLNEQRHDGSQMAPPTQHVIVEFRGTHFTVEGLPPERAEQMHEGLELVANAILGPRNHRGS